MELQYPMSVHNILLKTKLDWLDTIKPTKPKDDRINVNFTLYRKFQVNLKLTWKNSIRTLLVEFLAAYVFCHDSLNPYMNFDQAEIALSTRLESFQCESMLQDQETTFFSIPMPFRTPNCAKLQKMLADALSTKPKIKAQFLEDDSIGDIQLRNDYSKF